MFRYELDHFHEYLKTFEHKLFSISISRRFFNSDLLILPAHPINKFTVSRESPVSELLGGGPVLGGRHQHSVEHR